MIKCFILGMSTFIFFLGSFLLYARTVVPLVELPQAKLDDRLAPHSSDDPAKIPRALQSVNDSDEVRLAQKVFGPDSWEARALFRMSWKKSGVAIFADQLEQTREDEAQQTPEGEADFKPHGTRPSEAVLKPFSMVFFQPDQGYTTLECPEARLRSRLKLSVRNHEGNELTGGKLVGEITIRNRRGTPEPEDDFVIKTRDLEFSKEEGKFWTEAPVVFRDGPHQGRGRGLDLLTDPTNKEPSPGNAAGFGGVRTIVLRRDVQMQVKLDRDGGFLSRQPNHDETNPAEDEASSMVAVQSQGSLQFDLKTYKAVFRKAVHVERPTEQGLADTLDCDRLEIVFRRQDPSQPTAEGESPADSNPGGLVFQSLNATGKQVVLSSPAQDLRGVVTRLVYDADTKTTVLASDTEVVLLQAQNEMRCRQLALKQSDAAGAIREMEAQGPGWLRANLEDGAGRLDVHWNEIMRSFPQDDFTVLAFVGNTRIQQTGQGDLSANEVFLWIEPAEPDENGTTGESGQADSGFQIDRMLAAGEVRLTSAQLDGEFERLEMWFEAAPANLAVASTSPTLRRTPAPTSGPAISPSSRPTTSRAPQPSRLATDEPLHVRAQVMRVKALRGEGQVQVTDLMAYENVHAFREPGADGGQSFRLSGDKLWVTEVEAASAKVRIDGAPAHVESDRLNLDGNTINLDYARNQVWVNGAGSLALPANLGGAEQRQAEKQSIEIDWQRRMFFNGEVAEFGGGVEIDLDGPHVRCENAEVTLAKPVSFRDPPEAGDERIEIKRVHCQSQDKPVVLDADAFENGALQGRDHAEVTSFDLDNETGEFVAQGPGVFVQTRQGMTNPLLSDQPADQLQVRNRPQGSVPVQSDEQDGEVRYTRIQFADSMKGNSLDRRTRFFGRVEVTYGPVEDFQGRIDPDRLPERAVWMRSNELEVSQWSVQPDGSRPVEMKASGKVRVETKNFTADSDRLDYDESKDLFILEGTLHNPVTLWRQKRHGGPRSSQRARKIWYWQRTDQVKVSDAQDGNFLDLPERRGR